MTDFPMNYSYITHTMIQDKTNTVQTFFWLMYLNNDLNKLNWMNTATLNTALIAWQ